MQLSNSFRRGFLDGICDPNQPRHFLIHRDEHNGLAVSTPGFGGVSERFHLDLGIFHEFAIAEKDHHTVNAGLDPFPCH